MAKRPENEIHVEILERNQRVLDAVAAGDWRTYEALCDPTLSCFEPEARGHLVEGLEFHRFYFAPAATNASRRVTMASPKVRLLGEDTAVLTYVRLNQSRDANGVAPVTARFEETRVWHRRDGEWRMVHLHRSENP